MYPIDFMTCTADDVIASSVTCHPSLLAETLRANETIHRQAAGIMADAMARKAARLMACDCGLAAKWVEDQEDRKLVFGERIQLFAAAARLQLIPQAVASAIIRTSDKGE